MDLGDRVKMTRVRSGLTQIEFSNLADVSSATISKLESARGMEVKPATAYKINQAINEVYEAIGSEMVQCLIEAVRDLDDNTVKKVILYAIKMKDGLQ